MSSRKKCTKLRNDCQNEIRSLRDNLVREEEISNQLRKKIKDLNDSINNNADNVYLNDLTNSTTFTDLMNDDDDNDSVKQLPITQNHNLDIISGLQDSVSLLLNQNTGYKKQIFSDTQHINNLRAAGTSISNERDVLSEKVNDLSQKLSSCIEHVEIAMTYIENMSRSNFDEGKYNLLMFFFDLLYQLDGFTDKASDMRRQLEGRLQKSKFANKDRDLVVTPIVSKPAPLQKSLNHGKNDDNVKKEESEIESENERNNKNNKENHTKSTRHRSELETTDKNPQNTNLLDVDKTPTKNSKSDRTVSDPPSTATRRSRRLSVRIESTNYQESSHSDSENSDSSDIDEEDLEEAKNISENARNKRSRGDDSNSNSKSKQEEKRLEREREKEREKKEKEEKEKERLRLKHMKEVDVLYNRLEKNKEKEKLLDEQKQDQQLKKVLAREKKKREKEEKEALRKQEQENRELLKKVNEEKKLMEIAEKRKREKEKQEKEKLEKMEKLRQNEKKKQEAAKSRSTRSKRLRDIEEEEKPDESDSESESDSENESESESENESESEMEDLTTPTSKKTSNSKIVSISATLKTPLTNNKKPSPKENVSSQQSHLFSEVDDDDLFDDIHTNTSTKSSTKPKKSVLGFDDSDDDLGSLLTSPTPPRRRRKMQNNDDDVEIGVEIPNINFATFSNSKPSHDDSFLNNSLFSDNLNTSQTGSVPSRARKNRYHEKQMDADDLLNMEIDIFSDSDDEEVSTKEKTTKNTVNTQKSTNPQNPSKPEISTKPTTLSKMSKSTSQNSLNSDDEDKDEVPQKRRKLDGDLNVSKSKHKLLSSDDEVNVSSLTNNKNKNTSISTSTSYFANNLDEDIFSNNLNTSLNTTANLLSASTSPSHSPVPSNSHSLKSSKTLSPKSKKLEALRTLGNVFDSSPSKPLDSDNVLNKSDSGFPFPIPVLPGRVSYSSDSFKNLTMDKELDDLSDDDHVDEENMGLTRLMGKQAIQMTDSNRIQLGKKVKTNHLDTLFSALSPITNSQSHNNIKFGSSSIRGTGRTNFRADEGDDDLMKTSSYIFAKPK